MPELYASIFFIFFGIMPLALFVWLLWYSCKKRLEHIGE